MNLTFAIDDALLERAREIARRQGKSLNELIRDYLRTLAGETAGKETAAELLSLMRHHGGSSGGKRFRREDAYEGRL